MHEFARALIAPDSGLHEDSSKEEVHMGPRGPQKGKEEKRAHATAVDQELCDEGRPCLCFDDVAACQNKQDDGSVLQKDHGLDIYLAGMM
jgi:hypothetical protein